MLCLLDFSAGGGGMNMANGQGKGVSGIVSSGKILQLENIFHHDLDLVLFSAPITCHCALNFQGTIFVDGNPCVSSSKNHHALDLPKFHHALEIREVKLALNSGDLW